jgi:hypothetical protein
MSDVKLRNRVPFKEQGSGIATIKNVLDKITPPTGPSTIFSKISAKGRKSPSACFLHTYIPVNIHICNLKVKLNC